MSAEAFAEILANEPLCLADVGASYFLSDNWKYFFPLPTSQFVLFDPVGKNLAYAKELPTERVTVIPAALDQKNGVSEFFLANTDSGSSLLPPHPWPGRPALNHDYFFPLKVLDIETATIASCLDKSGIQAVHAIKLDTQGSELNIIRGFDDDRLRKLLLVEMEVSMDSYRMYLGAARFAEVIDYFEGHGFRFINTRIARKPLDHTGCVGAAFASTLPAQHECDALFVKDIIHADYENDAELMRELRQLVALLCAYYLHGEAVETVQLAAEKLPDDRSTFAQLVDSIGRVAASQSNDLAQGSRSLWHLAHS